jgi:hypothetical protein
MIKNGFKDGLATGRTQFGLSLALHSPMTVEPGPAGDTRVVQYLVSLGS